MHLAFEPDRLQLTVVFDLSDALFGIGRGYERGTRVGYLFIVFSPDRADVVRSTMGSGISNKPNRSCVGLVGLGSPSQTAPLVRACIILVLSWSTRMNPHQGVGVDTVDVRWSSAPRCSHGSSRAGEVGTTGFGSSDHRCNAQDVHRLRGGAPSTWTSRHQFGSSMNAARRDGWGTGLDRRYNRRRIRVYHTLSVTCASMKQGIPSNLIVGWWSSGFTRPGGSTGRRAGLVYTLRRPWGSPESSATGPSRQLLRCWVSDPAAGRTGRTGRRGLEAARHATSAAIDLR